MRGKQGVRVFMLSPHGRMSPFQQAQMFSLQDANIHNIAVEGVFDDCQDIVKAVCNDLTFKRRYRIGTVNSINWARLLAQVVYYFAGYFQATRVQRRRAVSFAVPSGNFGNICAGHVARMMGLPIDKLVLATNENDVLDEFFRTGTYRVRGSAETLRDLEPVDGHQQGQQLRALRLRPAGPRCRAHASSCSAPALARDGGFTLTAAEFAPHRAASASSRAAARMPTAWPPSATPGSASASMIDTHTADGLKVAREHLQPGVPMIVLETALPAKFAATIHEALGRDPEPPAALRGIEALPKRFTVMPVDVAAVKRYIEAHCAMNAPTRRAPAAEPGRRAGPPGAGAAPHAITQTETVSTFDAPGPRAGRRCRLGARRAARGQHLDGRLRAARRRRARGRHRAAGVAAHPGRRGGPPLCPARPRASSPAAQVPAGADAIVMQEQCDAGGRRRPGRRAREHRARSLANGSGGAAKTCCVAPWCWRAVTGSRRRRWGWRPRSVRPCWPWCAARAWRFFPPATN